MDITFNQFIDMVRELSLEEKEEIKSILEKDIIESRRSEIYQNYLDSKEEYNNGNLNFYNDIDDLKKSIG